jgi:hypothetical protein
VSALVVGIVLYGSREKGVDEGRLSETRLASNLGKLVSRSFSYIVDHSYHDGEGSTTLCDDLVSVPR